MDADSLAEGPQAGGVGDDDVVARPVESASSPALIRDDAEPGEQVEDAVGEGAAGGGVDSLSADLPEAERDAPSVAHRWRRNTADLGVGGRVEGGGEALLVRAEILDAELGEPHMQWIPAPCCSVRRGQVGVPPVPAGATRRAVMPNSAAAAVSTKSRFAASPDV